MSIECVSRAENFAHLRLILREIVHGDQSAERGHVLHEHACCFAAIKFRDSVSRNALQCRSEFRLAKSFAGFVHFSIFQEYSTAPGEHLQMFLFFLEFFRKFCANWITAFGKPNRGSHHVGKFHAAVSF